jgi:hypothetical protein
MMPYLAGRLRLLCRSLSEYAGSLGQCGRCPGMLPALLAIAVHQQATNRQLATQDAQVLDA